MYVASVVDGTTYVAVTTRMLEVTVGGSQVQHPQHPATTDTLCRTEKVQPIRVLDLTATDGDLKGFFGGFAPDGYVRLRRAVYNRAMFDEGRFHSAAPPSCRCSCSS